MVYTFDSLGYARRLRDNGVPQNQAEAHAEAARDFVMSELVTKADLRAELQATKADLRAEIQVTKADLRAGIQATKADLRAEIQAVRTDLETQTLRITVRFGAMLVVGLGALATLLRLS